MCKDTVVIGLGNPLMSDDGIGTRVIAELEKHEHLPEDVELTGVEFPIRGKMSSGQAQIYFYAKGYSDKALIHMQEDNQRRVSFLIEPFLPQTKYIEGQAGFDN